MFYADWIRAIAVHSVIFIHCLLNAADTVNLQDRDAIEKKEGICKIMAQLGMPMFFYISGMSLTFTNTAKTNYFGFFKGKLRRLVVPFFLACLTLLIPRLYLSQEYEHWTRIDGEVENNFLVYMWKTIPSLHSKLSWLWFLPVLFVIMLLNYPFLVFTSRRKNKLPFSLQEDSKLIFGQILTLVVWAGVCFLIVEESEFKDYMLPSIVTLVLFYLTMMTWALCINSSMQMSYKLALWAKLIGPIFCVMMNNFKKGSNDSNLFGMLLGLNYQSMFVAQGILDQYFLKECLKYREELA